MRKMRDQYYSGGITAEYFLEWLEAHKRYNQNWKSKLKTADSVKITGSAVSIFSMQFFAASQRRLCQVSMAVIILDIFLTVI